jgi:hypothetical protein
MNNPFETCHLESDKLRNSAQPENLVIESRTRDAQPASDQTDKITNVELSRINQTGIKLAADFEDPAKYAALRREAGMLKQMQPALDQGANADTFDSWDKANGIGHYTPNGYVRGYTNVYHPSQAVRDCGSSVNSEMEMRQCGAATFTCWS